MKKSSLVVAVLLFALSARADLLTGPVRYAAELRGSGSTSFGSAYITFDPATHTLAFEIATVAISGEVLFDVHRTNGDTSILHLFEGVSTHASGSADIGTFETGSFNASDLAALADPAATGAFYLNVHTTAFPAGEIRGRLTAAQELDIPVAGHVTNANGQTFISDVRVFNASQSARTTMLIEFIPASITANRTAAKSLVVDLPPRATSVLNDVLSGLNLSGIGALRISSASSIIATSRVYVNTSGGSFGQFVPAIPREQALRRGAIPQVSTPAFRANAGFFNPNAAPATVALQLRDANGALLGENTIALAALSQQQNPLAAYFPGADIANANLTLSFDSTLPVFAYVSEVDNVSGDSFFIAAQSDAGIQNL